MGKKNQEQDFEKSSLTTSQLNNFQNTSLDQVSQQSLKVTIEEEEQSVTNNQKKEEAAKTDDEDELLRLQKSLLSDMKFETLNKPSPGGSSFTQWFVDKDRKAEWIGKCSVQAVQNKSSFDEYKEYLASKLYELFGVKIPKTMLTEQYLDDKIQQHKFWSGFQGINKPKIHIISQFVPSFELLGKSFLHDYKNSSAQTKNDLFHITESKRPLRGFERVMAVAILVQDYDFIDNSGRNLGYIPKENGKYFEILKIDPGEALTLEEVTRLVPSI